MLNKTGLAAYLGRDEASLPSDVDKTLRDAEDLVRHASMDRTLRTQYEIELFARAVYAQVEWWLASGDPLGVASSGDLKGISVGSLNIQYNTDKTDGGNVGGICPRTRQYLARTGLLYRGVRGR